MTLVGATEARKRAKRLAAAGLGPKAENALADLEADPFRSSPFEKPVGGLSGSGSRRATVPHRLAYQVFADGHAGTALGVWPHDE